MEITERKHWLDNIRWITIIIVVLFHAFFYYNNIGIEKPMFKGLSQNPSAQGEALKFTFAGIFQYGVYQWFMALLFVVSGISARYTLKKKTLKEFIKSRTDKILIPSTLGVVAIQWLSGWINIIEMGGEEMASIPFVIKYFISVLMGTGALWFCHVLYAAVLLLALIKVIDRKSILENLGEKSNIFIAIALIPVMFGAAQILNMPMVTVYRMCYYPLSFLAGYYIFSSDKLQLQLKKFGWIFLILGLTAGFFYVKKFYGIYYSEYQVLNNWISVLYAWLMILGILGVSQTLLNTSNKFTSYMTGCCFGIYVNHLILMQVTNILLKPAVKALPFAVIYAVEFVAAISVSILLWELFKRTPVLRYILYGIRKQKKTEEK